MYEGDDVPNNSPLDLIKSHRSEPRLNEEFLMPIKSTLDHIAVKQEGVSTRQCGGLADDAMLAWAAKKRAAKVLEAPKRLSPHATLVRRVTSWLSAIVVARCSAPHIHLARSFRHQATSPPSIVRSWALGRRRRVRSRPVLQRVHRVAPGRAGRVCGWPGCAKDVRPGPWLGTVGG